MRAMPRVRCFRPQSRLRCAGVTLVELMIVLLVGAILMGLAIPSMQRMLSDNQLLALTDGLAGSLNLARSEAGRLGGVVSLSSGIIGGSADWGTSGWIMKDPAGATIRSGNNAPNGFTLRSSVVFATTAGLQFDSTGHVVPVGGISSGVFVVCQGGGPWVAGGAARMITVAPSGRIHIAQNDGAGQPLDDGGVAITSCTPP
jgi:type IV fimbrial biogenesis protein FimT